MNTKQKLTFLGVLFVGAGAAYAAMTNHTARQSELVNLTRMSVLAAEADVKAGAEAEVKTNASVEADAEQDARLKKMIAYRGDTPVVADFCYTNPKWPSDGEHEMTCHLTGFRGFHEIYTAGWKVTSVAYGQTGVPEVIGADHVFIERIGAEQWKGQQVGFKKR